MLKDRPEAKKPQAETGRIMPANAMAQRNSVVATGLLMNGAEKFMAAPQLQELPPPPGEAKRSPSLSKKM